MKKLTIGLIQYNETEETCRHVLNMIDNQIDFNFGELEVIIVNDCSKNPLKDEFLNSFRNFKPRHIIRETNGGPGMARQTVIDNASGEYITFIDIDDTWSDCRVLSFFNSVIYPEQMDIAQTPFMANHKMPGTDKWMYPLTPPNFTWMFGIFWKREFLKVKKVRHSEELRVHEDSYFVRLAASSTDKIKVYNEYSFYLWRQTEDSITRCNGGAYGYNSYATYIRAVDLLCDEKTIRARQQLPETVVQQIIYSYFCMNNPEWDKEEAKPYIEQTEKMVSYFYNKWKEHWDNCPEEAKEQCFKQTYGHASNRYPLESFKDWFERIKALNQIELPNYTQPNITIAKKGVN